MTQRELTEDQTLAAGSLEELRQPTPPARSVVPEAESPWSGAAESLPPPDGGCRRQVLANRYEILRLVGAGGMGNVYCARDLELDEIVALKTLRREIADKPGIVERFRREVRLARRVTHPNVARVFDIGEHDGDKFLTMEYIEGEALADVLAREGPLAVDRAVELARAVCAGLGAAHRAGVIHRDLKPDNVLLAKDGRVVLTDFGIARALDPAGGGGNTVGVTLGTPAYMAPEQVQGRDDIDARADIYALGAMLYEIFTGERAWRGDGAFAVAAARLVSDPPDPRTRRPDLPAAFARLILRCLARDRDDRFPSAEAVAEELGSLTQPAAPLRGVALPRAPEPGPPVVPAASPTDKSVAVLPFRNQGPADDEFLADELTDDLIDTLSMTRGLKVRPRGVVARWKGVDQDPRDIGRELGVQVVADGSVRRRGGSVRISARLISVADGFQLWARRLDRPEHEVLQMSDEVAQAIVEALTAEAAAAPARHAPADPVVIDLFLRARHEYRKFWPTHQRRAIELYDEALARAPGDPMILSAAALARTRLWFFTGDGGDVAAQAAERAVRVAPDLADARLALASVRFQQGDAVGAVRELKRALARNPALAEAQSLLGSILGEIGEVEAARGWLEAALSLDPTVAQARQALVRILALHGRWDEAGALLAQEQGASTELAATRLRLAFWRRDAATVRATAEAMEGASNERRGIARELAEIVERGEFPAERPQFFQIADQPGVAARRRAFVHQLAAESEGYLGRGEQALATVERAIEAGLIDVVWLERCPPLEPVRRLPRYEQLHAALRRRADAILEAYREP
jgi:serine/threonine-protein kinase